MIRNGSTGLLRVLLLLVAFAVNVSAQGQPSERSVGELPDRGHRSTKRLVASGVVSAVAGGLAGWLIGGSLGGRDAACSAWDCNGFPAVVGAVTGHTITVPFGVHMSNGRMGDIYSSGAAVATMGLAGIGAILITGKDSVVIPVMVALPLAQTIAAAVVERQTSGAGRY
jgi:hypothetical protein